MIAFWNRAEVYVGSSEQDFMRVRNRLDEAGVRHTYRIVRDNSMPGNRAWASHSTMYYIYVHRKDVETVTGRIQ